MKLFSATVKSLTDTKEMRHEFYVIASNRSKAIELVEEHLRHIPRLKYAANVILMTEEAVICEKDC